MKIVASIQARLSSSRLPGKVLKKLEGKPVLQWQVERLRRSRLIDEIIIATTTNPIDDRVEEFCRKNQVTCFRGSEHDVLQRIADLITEHQADVHIECFGDSPLIDPQIVDEYIGFLLKNKDRLDLVTNTQKTTYPPGSEVTVYKGCSLLEANMLVESDDPLREHVSFNIKSRPQLFSIVNLEAPPYLNCPDLYIELDTPEDLLVMQFIIENMMKTEYKNFSLVEVIKLMKDNPEKANINNKVNRRWKKFVDNV